MNKKNKEKSKKEKFKEEFEGLQAGSSEIIQGITLLIKGVWHMLKWAINESLDGWKSLAKKKEESQEG